MSREREARDRARAYFESKGALAPAAVREQIVAAFDALDAALAGVSAEQARRPSIPGEWSVQEVVDHLLETYRPGVDELRCLLAGCRPPGEPIPAGLQSKAPLLRPWPWLLDELRRTHGLIVDLIAAVPEDFTTAARVPFVMVVNVPGSDGALRPLEWIEEVDWKAYAIASWRLHAIDHLNQVRKVLAAGRELSRGSSSRPAGSRGRRRDRAG
jgi:hypothetical protein